MQAKYGINLLSQFQTKRTLHQAMVDDQQPTEYLYGTVSATSHGNVLDRKRGWANLEVEIEEVFIGLNDKTTIEADVLSEYGISRDDYARISQV